MKWLIITDNKNNNKKITDLIKNINQNNEFFDFELDNFNLNQSEISYEELIAAFFYSDDNSNVSNKSSHELNSLSGFLIAKKIPVFSNITFIKENSFLQGEFLFISETIDSLFELIKSNETSVIENAKKRIAKNKLLDRGIPFTSDCFATYIAKNKMEIFNEFLEAGMEVNCRDDLGTPMLNIACRNDNFEFVEVLLDLGAELNAISEDRGYTAVMDAVWRGNEKIAKYLIDKGAELNTINKEGQTNLVLAVGANRENIVKLLAENGADPDVKDMMGMSAYNYATLFKKQKLVDILKPYHKE